jgi:PAS domain S-box-containing protein
MTRRNKNLRKIFLAAMAVILVLSVLSYSKINSLIQSGQLVNHTTNVTLEIEKFIGNLKDAETTHRGYLLTHDGKFLEPLDKALKEYPENLKALKKLVQENAMQRKLLISVEQLAQHHENYMRKLLEVDKERAPTPTELLYGVAIMDSLRADVSGIAAIENYMLKQRTSELERQMFLAPAMLFIFSMIALCILFIAFYQLNKSLLHAQQLKTQVDATILSKNKIEESQKELQSLVKQAAVAIVLFEGEELIARVANEYALVLMGKTENEVLNRRMEESFPELPDRKNIYLKVLKTGTPYIGKEVKISYNRFGMFQTAYFDLTYSPWVDSEGNIKGVMSVGVEVTEMVLARKRIEESEQRFAAMVQQAPVAMSVLKGENFVVETANEKQLQLWGKTKEQVINRPIFEAIPEGKGQRFEEMLHGVFTTGIPYVANESPIALNRNGKTETIYVNFVYEPLFNNQHKIEGVLSAAFDITEHVLARKRIEESEERFRWLAQTLPQLVWLTDAQGNPEFASSRWKEYTGIEPAGENEWKAVVHPDDYNHITATWIHSLTTGCIYNADVRIKSSTGEYRWYTVKGIPVLNAENKIVKWVGAFTDTHREKLFTQELELMVKERTSTLEQFNIELDQKNKELQSFAYISSHDLQEPLRKIQAFASRIAEKEKDVLSDYGKDYFNRIQVAASRMQMLIKDLLAYSRTNTSERKFELTDLNKIIDEVKEDLSELIASHQATIEAGDLCHVPVITFQFRQLMYNLLSNAIKFSDPARPPHIKITAQTAMGAALNNTNLLPQQSYCHITMTDNGIGFEQQYSNKIFEVFQRLHGKTEYSGTGIGLSIVKKIVENHHGIITAKGALNKGATFEIFIPAT